MAESVAGKRPAEESSDAPAATKRRVVVSKSRTVQEFKKEALDALNAASPWEALQLVLAEALTVEELPHLIYLLYADLVDLVDEALLEKLLAYMHTDAAIAVCSVLPMQPSRRVDFVQSILLAIKSIASRPLQSRLAQGLAQLLNARVGCLRLELNIMSRATLRSNETLAFLSETTPPPSDKMQELFELLRTDHSVALPDGVELANDLQTLKALSKKLVHDKPTSGASRDEVNTKLKAAVTEVEAAIPRVLTAVNEITTAYSTGSVAEVVKGKAVESFATHLQPTWLLNGAWCVFSLFQPGVRLFVLLTADAVLGSLIQASLDELCKRNPSGTDAVIEGCVGKLLRIRRDIFKAVDTIATLPAGPHPAPLEGVAGTQTAAKVSDSFKTEFFRESVWLSWKKQGASGRVFDGIAGAAEDAKARATGEAKKKSQLYVPSERLNKVQLGESKRKEFSFEMRGVKEGSHEWVTWSPFPHSYPAAFFNEPRGPPPTPKEATPITLLKLKYEDKLLDVWGASRLAVEQHMKQTLIDDTFYLTDINKIDTVVSAAT